MISRSKSIIMISVCILFQNNTQCFQEYLADDIGKSRIQGVIISTITNLGILAFGKKLLGKLPDATKEAKEFVQEIADDHGLPHDFEVKVGDGYAAGIGTIILEKDAFSQSTLDEALRQYNNAETNEEKTAALEKLDEHIGILDHEFTHYKNHDVRTALLTTAAMNLGLYAAYMAFEYKYLSDHFKKWGTFKKHSYLIASDVGLAITSILLNFWNRRKQEARADEGVRNNLYVLKAMVLWAQRLQKETKEHLANSTWLAKKIGSLLEKYPSLYLLLDPLHPTLPSREARFKERYVLLRNNAEVGILI